MCYFYGLLLFAKIQIAQKEKEQRHRMEVSHQITWSVETFDCIVGISHWPFEHIVGTPCRPSDHSSVRKSDHIVCISVRPSELFFGLFIAWSIFLLGLSIIWSVFWFSSTIYLHVLDDCFGPKDFPAN